MKEKYTAIVLAAGSGKRMKSAVQKQYMDLQGKPILYYALKSFEDCPFIEQIILVTQKEEIKYCQEHIVQKYHFRKVTDIVAGGSERYLSVYQALTAIKDCDYVYIHDGARPFLDEAMLERLKEAVLKHGSCVAAVQVKDTIKIADDELFAKETPKRSELWSVQTPQVFQYHAIKKAYEKLMKEAHETMAVTDDAMVMEKMEGVKVKLVEGAYTNIKITTPEDLQIAEVFVKSATNEKIEKIKKYQKKC